jgi:altronate hydrolase
VGLNCGGSDSFSGITANPALGVCSDLLAAIRSERRCWPRPPRYSAPNICWCDAPVIGQVAEKLLGFVEGYKQYLESLRRQLRRQSFARQQRRRPDQHSGKIAGRGGQGRHQPLNDAIDYAERVSTPGFVFMNTPGHDPVSLTGLGGGRRAT